MQTTLQPFVVKKKNGAGRKPTTQARLFKYLWYHPHSNLKQAAQELKISYSNAKKTHYLLKMRKDLHIRCPECFRPTFFSLVCQVCGFEGDRPFVPIEGYFDQVSPVHSIQPLNGLGSQTDYSLLRFAYGGRNIKHLVERSEDVFLESCKSLLWQELKSYMPQDEVVEEATRLLVKEVIEFRAKYPLLVNAKDAKRQIVSNVVERLRLITKLRNSPSSSVLRSDKDEY
jgi:hypothetical protein